MGDIADDHMGYIADELERGFINEYGLYEEYQDQAPIYYISPAKPKLSYACKYCSTLIRFVDHVAYDAKGKHLCLRGEK